MDKKGPVLKSRLLIPLIFSDDGATCVRNGASRADDGATSSPDGATWHEHGAKLLHHGASSILNGATQGRGKRSVFPNDIK